MVLTLDWSHEITLAADPRSVARARDFICLHLLAHRLASLVEDMRLVVSELATNAVAHAATPFVVTLSSRNGMMLLEVQDGSPSAVVSHTPDVMDESGRGVMIVDLLSREWGTSIDDRGFKSVWASFAGQV